MTWKPPHLGLAFDRHFWQVCVILGTKDSTSYRLSYFSTTVNMRGGGLRLLITLAFFITADLTPTTRGQGLEGDIQPSRIARSSPLRWGKRGGNNILRWGKREAVADADMEDEDGPHRERREAPLRLYIKLWYIMILMMMTSYVKLSSLNVAIDTWQQPRWKLQCNL